MDSVLVIALIEAIAQADGVSPMELDYTVAEYIDLEALAAFESHPNDEWEVRFAVPDHDVVVSGEGIVTVDGVQFDTDGRIPSIGK